MTASRALRWIAVGVCAAVLTGCGWRTNSAQSRTKADTFTQSVVARGLAPAMTPAVARSLYGADGGDVCAALARGEQSPALAAWARTNVRGQPEKQARHVIEYDRVVIMTYCPQQLDRFDALASDLGYSSVS